MAVFVPGLLPTQTGVRRSPTCGLHRERPSVDNWAMNFASMCSRHWRSLFGALIALATSASLAAPAVATPGDDAHVVVKSADAVANGPASALVDCPAGERAIGGGAGFVAAYTDTVMTLTTPVDETGDLREADDGDIPRYWYTRVVNGLNESMRFTFYAICSASSDAVLASEPFTTTQANTPTYAVAACPVGQRAIGGGVTNATSLSSMMHTNGPLDETGQAVNTVDGDVARSWIGAVESTTNVTQNYQALAVCSAASTATIQTDAVAIGGSAPDKFLQRSTTCPAGQRALSGGFISTSSVAARLAVSAPIALNGGFNVLVDGDAAGGWMVDAENFSGTPADLQGQPRSARRRLPQRPIQGPAARQFPIPIRRPRRPIPRSVRRPRRRSSAPRTQRRSRERRGTTSSSRSAAMTRSEPPAATISSAPAAETTPSGAAAEPTCSSARRARTAQWAAPVATPALAVAAPTALPARKGARDGSGLPVA